MAKVRLLVDTDIIIDYLKGIKPAKELFRSGVGCITITAFVGNAD